MKSASISVVLITYNYSQYILQSIASVLDGLPENSEVVVVDDGSTDDTRDKLGTLNNASVRVLFKQNGGPSTALNHGINHSTGEYIAIMSGDDISLPQGISRRLAYLQNTQADIVSSVPVFIDGEGNSVVNEQMSPVFAPLDDMSNPNVLRRLLFLGNFISAPSIMMRRAVVDKVGLHLDSLFQLQDYELWIRAVLAGFRISISHAPFIKYRLHASNLSSPANQERTYWELASILRKYTAELSRETIDALSSRHSATDPDSVARALLFVDSSHPIWRTVSQEYLEIAMLDNEAAAILRSVYGLGPKEIFERRKTLTAPSAIAPPS
ncbi:MAG: glycosyltransferase [Xanthobacteraceae bacterium]|nr:glycosyltransferase [Xanthobacteraceae bacterium]